MRFFRWQGVVLAMASDTEIEQILVDLAIVRTTTFRRSLKEVASAFGRSRGGLSSRLHLAVDAAGRC